MSAVHRLFPALMVAVLSLSAPTALAADGACLTQDQSKELTRFQERLRRADSVDDARRIADRRLRSARGVLQKARALHPKNEGIQDGMQRLEDMQTVVQSSATPGGVAQAFDAPRANGLQCDMSGGEVVATVIGFVLGILPGIILLLVLC